MHFRKNAQISKSKGWVNEASNFSVSFIPKKGQELTLHCLFYLLFKNKTMLMKLKKKLYNFNNLGFFPFNLAFLSVFVVLFSCCYLFSGLCSFSCCAVQYRVFYFIIYSSFV